MKSALRKLILCATVGLSSSLYADVCETVTKEQGLLASDFIQDQISLDAAQKKSGEKGFAYIYDTTNQLTHKIVEGLYAPNTGRKSPVDGKTYYRFSILTADKKRIFLENLGKVYLAVGDLQNGISLQFLSRCGANYGQNLVIPFPFNAEVK